MALSLSNAPATEPVTLAEAKTHLRIDHTAEDGYIEDFVIPAARRYAETLTHRAFIAQTWILRLNGFGVDPIFLPRPPLVSITSIAYTDISGDSQTWSASATGYVLEKPAGEYAMNASVRPAYSMSYPTTRNDVDSVVLTYVAGYGSAGVVPVGVKQGVLMLVDDLYSNRGSRTDKPSVPAAIAAQALLSPFVAYRYDLRFD
jgi:uncharacterized phiE125 gp8 family phage protein|tara:strand:- start:447 stop:1052 length:606 start_codon:yes stop_codon:yes gene_type:complete